MTREEAIELQTIFLEKGGFSTHIYDYTSKSVKTKIKTKKFGLMVFEILPSKPPVRSRTLHELTTVQSVIDSEHNHYLSIAVLEHTWHPYWDFQ